MFLALLGGTFFGSGMDPIIILTLRATEIDRTRGSVFLPKKLATAVDEVTGLYDGTAYCSQLPWLEHASIRNSPFFVGVTGAEKGAHRSAGCTDILFGSPFEEDRYEEVLDACALRPDLEMFEARDEVNFHNRLNLCRSV